MRCNFDLYKVKRQFCPSERSILNQTKPQLMEPISVFDMFKIGIGPSSSHTLGPWRAAQRFVKELHAQNLLPLTSYVRVHLYGSLALTGKGHGTDIAILLGLSGYDPENIPVPKVHEVPQRIEEDHLLLLNGDWSIPFNPKLDIAFHMTESLPQHANGLAFEAWADGENKIHEGVFYSVGGGFVIKENEDHAIEQKHCPYLVYQAKDLSNWCHQHDRSIAALVYENELSWRQPKQIEEELMKIWEVMKQCAYAGCHASGVLPGGLNVNRRAPNLYNRLTNSLQYDNPDAWIEEIKKSPYSFNQIVKWIGCFAMAVNEQNASFGRVVTAPTNGAAGVIPAVLLYYICFSGEEVTDRKIVDFLLVAGVIGSIFKNGATISAAMGGCQAEIGVSSAMAAAALTEALGGNVEQALMAAEIAMEHHLGLTCDPVGGLVQIPCIERNSMGAMKAITACNIALDSDPKHAKVTLDKVVQTMWETAQDMNHKYKETSLGGLATQVSIGVPEC